MSKGRKIIFKIKLTKFFITMFNHLEKSLSLNIVRYNNQLKNILGMNINDYENCSKIEIDIFPIPDKIGKFVNVNAKNKDNLHIYLNDDLKESKKYNISKDDHINKI